VIRTCSGQDPNLITEDGLPCACGLTFDDVERMVIFPHRELPPKRSLEELEALVPGLREYLDRAIGEPYRFDPPEGSFADEVGRLLSGAHDALFDAAMGASGADPALTRATADWGASEPLTVKKLAAYLPVSTEMAIDAGLLTEEEARARGWTPVPVARVPWWRRLRYRWSGLRNRLGTRLGSFIAGVGLDERRDDG
jgi:hypothetical protein